MYTTCRTILKKNDNCKLYCFQLIFNVQHVPSYPDITQYRHSIDKRRDFVLANSVKRNDVTRCKQGYITPPPPYFIL